MLGKLFFIIPVQVPRPEHAHMEGAFDSRAKDKEVRL
jgi:hypothetical protein